MRRPVLPEFRQGLDVLDADQPLPDPALPADIPRSHVVRDPVQPNPERAPPVELREAPPELQVDLLQQVAARFRIELIGARQTIERRAMALCRLFVQRILVHSCPLTSLLTIRVVAPTKLSYTQIGAMCARPL